MEDITIALSANDYLAATRFDPPKACKGAVMIAPATGIRRHFYTALANHLAASGYGVLTFDNQGIGDSLMGGIGNCKVSLQDWGYVDMPSVLDQLKSSFPNTKYHLIGHSAGGQLVGLMHNWRGLSSMVTVASSSGRLKNMSLPFLLQARFFMHVFIPGSNALFGYTKTHWVGMGEPLPLKVAAQWSEWCRGQGYVKTAFDKTVFKHHYDQVDLPTKWILAKDDPIANEANADDMIAVTPNLRVEKLILDPSESDANEIGHMKFFSKSNQKLWDHAVQWLDTYSH